MLFTASNHYKYRLLNHNVDWDAPDAFKYALTRAGFVFSPLYSTYGCLNAYRNGATTFNFGSQSIARTTGSWSTDKFVPGNLITTSAAGSNYGPFLVTVVTTLVLTVTDPTGSMALLTDVSTSCAITANDELGSGYGYTLGGTALAGENAGLDLATDNAYGFWNDIALTAAGGDIGPTAGIIIFDDTTSDDCIVGYFSFQTDRIIRDGTTMNVNSSTVNHI